MHVINQYIPRTVRLIEPQRDQRFGQEELSLHDFDTDHGVILLGDSGMGKSREFGEVARGIEERHCMSAREFLRCNLNCDPKWRTKTIFIDGLDEMRSGGGDPRVVLDKIINGIKRLGTPKFRLSCRPSSWFGTNDLKELRSLVDSKEISVLLLNPLNDDNIREVVSQHIQDVDAFVQQAHEFSMDAFLGNPQLLDFLITAVKNDHWPESQLNMLQIACRELIQEKNEEHLLADSSRLQQPWEAILTGAGKLCAYMLIANKSGWSSNATDNSDILSLRDLECDHDLSLREAFDSRIFRGSPRNKSPIHRLVAEFLGARYLNRKIENGTSVRRILALLMEHNGILLPDLRGLAAWLASLNSQARTILIQIDPTTIAFNGDTRGFSPDERSELLAQLEQHIHLNSDVPLAWTPYALIGNEGMSIIRNLTDLPERSKNRQILVYLLLRGLSQTCHPLNVSDREADHETLLNILRDPSWKSNVRCEALATLGRILHDSPQRGTLLRGIFNELIEKNILDEKQELQNALLFILYPDEISPADIWDCIIAGFSYHRDSVDQSFFATIVDQSNGNQIRELLDSLCDQASKAIPKLEDLKLSNIVLQLLSKGLDLFGDQLRISELYRWFTLVEYDDSYSQLIAAHTSRSSYSLNDDSNCAICNWLSQRESIQRRLIEYGLMREEPKIGSASLIRMIALKFIGHSAPARFRLWCLERAVQHFASNPKIAQELASWSIARSDSLGSPLSDDEILSTISDTPDLIQWNDQRLNNRDHAELEITAIQRQQQKIWNAHHQQKLKKIEVIRQQKTRVKKGQYTPAILDELAHIYFDHPNTEERNSHTCMRDYFEGDEDLVTATLIGFRSLLLDRNDLPDLDQITQLHQEGRRSLIALASLAGMEEEFKACNDLRHLSKPGIRRVLGFYLITESPRKKYLFSHHMDDQDKVPAWYQQILMSNPEAVADAMVSVHNANVRSSHPPNVHMYDMAFDSDYTQVAECAVPQMFTVFPSRCNSQKLQSLRVVLWSAILNHGIPTQALQNLISKRLNRKRMDIGQQAQWMAAGLLVNRELYLPMLSKFLSIGEEVRVHHIIDFFVPYSSVPVGIQTMEKWRSEGICQLIQIFGSRIDPPLFQDHAGIVNNEQGISHKLQMLMTHWLRNLKKRTCDDARKNLDTLECDESLATWKRDLVLAQKEQAKHRRATKHSDLSVMQIQKALREGSPANAADLTGILVDTLEKLADRVRHDSTNAWHQYWDWEQRPRRPLKPKPENDCRDTLLFHLESELKKYQVDAQPEDQYANSQRADIHVSYGSNLSIPIEVKKNSHVNLWRGITDQLVPKYTRDPKSDGYGIYLVFWFGEDKQYMRVVSPDGEIPKKPAELKELLEKRLDPELRKRIHVVIIDVAVSGRFEETHQRAVKDRI